MSGISTTNPDPFGDGSDVVLLQFESNAHDAAGNRNGTWTGNEQYDTGKFGQAAKFDGNSYIDYGGYVTCNTISLWVNINDTGGNQVIFREKSAPTSINMSFFRDNLFGHHRIGIQTQSLNYLCKTNIGFTQWYYIALVRNSSTSFSFYINGQFDNTVTTTPYQLDDNLYLRLSGIKENNHYNFNGLIDQVRIFNRALTDEEILQLYNEELGSGGGDLTGNNNECCCKHRRLLGVI